jgi:ribulose-5-phosphate 4-epimerase/fuculose-1-phosphate aldolase
MHVSIYNKLGKANAIVHTHSPYTNGIAISVIDEFQHIIEEAKIVVGNPVLIPNRPPGSAELANLVSEAFGHGDKNLTVVIIISRSSGCWNQYSSSTCRCRNTRRMGYLTVSKIFGGPKYVL